MQDQVAVFRTRRGREETLRTSDNHIGFEDRVDAMKRTHPTEKNRRENCQSEPGFPNNLIRQQITRLRVHYLSEPELKKLPRDIRLAEIRQDLYRFWDEATATLSDEPDLYEWVRQRIDNELKS